MDGTTSYVVVPLITEAPIIVTPVPSATAHEATASSSSSAVFSSPTATAPPPPASFTFSSGATLTPPPPYAFPSMMSPAASSVPGHEGWVDERHPSKVVWYDGMHTSIVIQNRNGPCPLLAICNVLFLRKQLTCRMEGLYGYQMVEMLADHFRTVPADIPLDATPEVIDSFKANHKKNVEDALKILPDLQAGLDVNVKFTGPQDFEFTPGHLAFDIAQAC
ncbi:Ubiquitin carboxyl-terminal hydrolase MINDY-2 [Pelomyxa schiedti]|nr:Ubiquitin carboxyl-terminal hydrolase MINDY-2 [Pelomyxa schiedti]